MDVEKKCIVKARVERLPGATYKSAKLWQEWPLAPSSTSQGGKPGNRKGLPAEAEMLNNLRNGFGSRGGSYSLDGEVNIKAETWIRDSAGPDIETLANHAKIFAQICLG